MTVIREKETKLGKVTLYQDDEKTSNYYVKSDDSWVVPIFSTVGYPKKKPLPLSYESAMDVFEKAIYDDNMVHDVVRGK